MNGLRQSNHNSRGSCNVEPQKLPTMECPNSHLQYPEKHLRNDRFKPYSAFLKRGIAPAGSFCSGAVWAHVQLVRCRGRIRGSDLLCAYSDRGHIASSIGGSAHRTADCSQSRTLSARGITSRGVSMAYSRAGGFWSRKLTMTRPSLLHASQDCATAISQV